MDNLNTLIQRQIDSILLVSAAAYNEELARTLKSISIPVVSFDRPVHNSPVPSVVSTNYKSAKEATRHLISHGCKQIVCLGMKGEESLYTKKERVRGYRAAMQEEHLTPRIDFSITSQESAVQALKAYLHGTNPPDGIFATKNLATISVFETLKIMRVKIPKQSPLLALTTLRWLLLLSLPSQSLNIR